MSRLKITMTLGAVVAIVFALAACGSSPELVDSAAQAPPDSAQRTTMETVKTPHEEVAANVSGLGTMVYTESAQVECEKRRRTGSRIRRSACDDDTGSYAVKTVNYDETKSTPTVVIGTSRPGTN